MLSESFIFFSICLPLAENTDQKVLASALSVESQAETLFAAMFALILGFLIDKTSLGLGIIIVSAVAMLLFNHI